MRDIKFRGKRISDGKWVYGYPLDLGINGFEILVVTETDELDENGDISFLHAIERIEVNCETVGQCIGKQDKSNNDIYEGDICQILWQIDDEGGKPDTVITAQITFEGGSFWFRGIDYNVCDCNWHFYDRSDIEVIGNIYDNPELLEEAKQ
ncbi:YopX family protein [Dehalococcoides mccartyi]|uniref:YopX family protein n=1 Tax=Dehalococcoides mccartyi TaxID=61435 RepID=UPI0008053432|nr:YopX family protein [Dehalococcoides mccartyi]OBW61980.1 MAG: hypothetical protein A9181_03155 [Dehalococcoides mccartyi]